MKKNKKNNKSRGGGIPRSDPPGGSGRSLTRSPPPGGSGREAVLLKIPTIIRLLPSPGRRNNRIIVGVLSKSGPFLEVGGAFLNNRRVFKRKRTPASPNPTIIQKYPRPPPKREHFCLKARRLFDYCPARGGAIIE